MTEHSPTPITTDSAEAALDAGLAAAFASDVTGDYQSRAAGFIPAEVAGTIIAGKYKLLERIGEGGMGSVWMAQQTEPVKRYVAVKLIKTGMDSKQVLVRFEAERQALAVMDHPNIAKILDGGLSPPVATGGLGTPYFVMELVKGVPITKYCDEHKLTPRQRLELFVPVCQAIQHAHQKGIIHRDIKPSNVMVALYDDKPIPKVIDFGVAKATGQSLTGQTLNTGFGGIVGTPEYMSPEQASLNNLDIDTRSDIYSLGVLLYELLAGSPPFKRKELEQAGLLEILRVIREEEPPRPSTKLSTADALPSLSANRSTEPRKLTGILRNELDWIVMKALEKDRARRYETANGFAADINRYLSGEPVNAHPPSVGYRLKMFLRKNKGPAIASAAVAAALLVGIVGFAWQARVAQGERNAAQAERDRATAAEAKAKEETAVALAVKNFLQFDLLAEAAPEKNPRDKQVTVEELLGRAAVRVTDKFGNQPLVEATIRETIANTYHALGNYPAAQPHLERALETFRRVLGDDDRVTLNCLGNMAILINDMGQSAQAEQLFEKQLEARRRVLGDEHPDTIVAMNNLAEMYRRRGDIRKAEPLYVQAIEVARRVRGEDHDDTQSSINNLALVYKSQGQFAKAESLFLETLNSHRRTRGEEHPETLTVLNNMATMYFSQGRYADAAPHFIKVLEVRRRALGPDHPTTLVSVINLASLYRGQGRYDLAEPLNVKALEVSRRDLGDDHLFTLQCLTKLAILRKAQGQFTLAEPLFAKALEVKRRVAGANHTDTLNALTDLAELYEAMKQIAKAEPLYRESLGKIEKLQGSTSLQTVAVQTSFGHNLLAQGKYAEAEPLLRAAFQHRSQMTPDAWTTFHTQSMLGGALLGQKRYNDAEPNLLQGFQGIFQRRDGISQQGKVRLTEALVRVVDLYTAWHAAEPTGGYDVKAAEWKAKLEAMKPAAPEPTPHDKK